MISPGAHEAGADDRQWVAGAVAETLKLVEDHHEMV